MRFSFTPVCYLCVDQLGPPPPVTIVMEFDSWKRLIEINMIFQTDSSKTFLRTKSVMHLKKYVQDMVVKRELRHGFIASVDDLKIGFKTAITTLDFWFDGRLAPRNVAQQDRPLSADMLSKDMNDIQRAITAWTSSPAFDKFPVSGLLPQDGTWTVDHIAKFDEQLENFRSGIDDDQRRVVEDLIVRYGKLRSLYEIFVLTKVVFRHGQSTWNVFKNTKVLGQSLGPLYYIHNGLWAIPGTILNKLVEAVPYIVKKCGFGNLHEWVRKHRFGDVRNAPLTRKGETDGEAIAEQLVAAKAKPDDGKFGPIQTALAQDEHDRHHGGSSHH